MYRLIRIIIYHFVIYHQCLIRLVIILAELSISTPFLLVYECYGKVFHIVIFEFVTVINISVIDSCVGGFGIKTK